MKSESQKLQSKWILFKSQSLTKNIRLTKSNSQSKTHNREKPLWHTMTPGMIVLSQRSKWKHYLTKLKPTLPSLLWGQPAPQAAITWPKKNQLTSTLGDINSSCSADCRLQSCRRMRIGFGAAFWPLSLACLLPPVALTWPKNWIRLLRFPFLFG